MGAVLANHSLKVAYSKTLADCVVAKLALSLSNLVLTPMDRRLIVAGRSVLKHLPVAIASTLSGGLWTAAGLLYLHAIHFPNYRLMNVMAELNLTLMGVIWAVLFLYPLGIYSGAWLMRRRYIRRDQSFSPLLLAASGFLGLMILAFWLQSNWANSAPPTIWDGLILVGICSVLPILAACQLKVLTTRSELLGLYMVVTLLLIAILPVFFFNYTDFPGANASIQAREAWGLKTFPFGEGETIYAGVNFFQNCKPVVDRVGDIQAVVPTKGANKFVQQLGSSPFTMRGEFTLEVVGSKGTGVANYGTDKGHASISFTSQGKKERLSCDSPTSQRFSF